MKILSFGEISKITTSRYALASLVSKRAREIVAGEDALIDTELENPVSIAMQEVAEGAVDFTTKERYEEILEEKRIRREALEAEKSEEEEELAAE